MWLSFLKVMVLFPLKWRCFFRGSRRRFSRGSWTTRRSGKTCMQLQSCCGIWSLLSLSACDFWPTKKSSLSRCLGVFLMATVFLFVCLFCFVLFYFVLFCLFVCFFVCFACPPFCCVYPFCQFGLEQFWVSSTGTLCPTCVTRICPMRLHGSLVSPVGGPNGLMSRNRFDEFETRTTKMPLLPLLLLMEEILHQLICRLSHYLQGFAHPWWCRISSINSTGSSLDSLLGTLRMVFLFPFQWDWEPHIDT